MHPINPFIFNLSSSLLDPMALFLIYRKVSSGQLDNLSFLREVGLSVTYVGTVNLGIRNQDNAGSTTRYLREVSLGTIF